VSMIGYAIVIVVYGFVLFPLVIALAMTLSTLSHAERSTEIFEGIGASCVVAVCAGIFLTRGFGVQPGILVWLAFVPVQGSLPVLLL
jgi:hypothetical protein